MIKKEHLNRNKKIAVLISGRGSNLHALIKGSLNNDFKGSINLIISNNKIAKGIIYAKEYDIKYHVIESNSHEKKTKFYDELLNTVNYYNIDIICLAGFMNILPDSFIQSFSGLILNIHPSLLPKYKGLNTHQRAIDNEDTYAGCTVHHVTNELDSGEIILQKSIKIENDDTAESLSLRVLELEHLIYSKALKKIID